MMKITSLFVAVLVGIFWSWLVIPAPHALADSSYYVKEGEDGDGSESDPFGSITDAIDEAKEHGGKKIIVAKGTYSSGFTLPKGVELVGSDTKDVIIKGLIRMEDKSKLSEVTVDTGGILTAGKADVTISKVMVKNVLAVGIKGEEGNGTIIVRDTVVEKSRKGFYLQKGNEIRAENIEVRNNTEEGMDIRENVSGSIRKSEFRDNGESGIEVVLGSSDLVIQSNTFSGNGASGIAAQFFKGASKVGDVRIDGNAMNGNTNYGIDCKTPQGGLESKDYFLNSISASGNTFSKNKEGEISNHCRVLTDEERVKLEEKEEVKVDQVLSPAEFAERVQQDATARKEYDDIRETAEREKVEAALAQLADFVARTESVKNSYKEQGAAECFLFGEDVETKLSLRLTHADLTSLLERVRTESEIFDFDANRLLVQEALATHEEVLETIEHETLVSPCGFSLLGWLNTLLANRRDVSPFVTSEETSLSFFRTSEERRMLFVGNIGYTPTNRSQILKHGDASPFADLKESLRSYHQVIGTLTSPMMDEADPAPVSGVAALNMPARFANIFATHNVRILHVGAAGLLKGSGEKGYLKTAVNMGLAGIETYGGLSANGISSRTLNIDGAPVTFLEYRESKTTQPAEMIDAISEAKESARAVVVSVAYDPTLSSLLTEERKSYAKRFVEAGAVLVIGTGLPLAPQSEVVGSGRIYYSLGNFWGGAGVAPVNGLAVELTLSGAEHEEPSFQEQVVSWSDEGKIILTPKE